ncbi:hypothetical protein [Asticcacaulis sp.]|uniref:hypothetical protein n=1 Tax=Asticcacaulis sp. TaxID=1872648 RepID=UPI002BD8A14A|nr:hypothetical protein [Asticcacaulis sp.]HTM80228.1 hypothetical protein [Asticcacaulis sp.]
MSKTLAAMALILPCLLLTQCDVVKKVTGGANPENPAVAFDVAIEMTPAAAARFKATGDTLVVDVAYYGYPTEAARPKVNNLQQIDLGQDLVGVIPTTEKVHVPGGGLNQKALPDVMGGNVMVLVDGYSITPDSNPDGQVKCSYYRDRLEMARTRAAIKCDIETP